MKKILLMAMVIGLFLGGFLLGMMVNGCATHTGYWTKSDYIWEQYKTDSYECEGIAQSRATLGNIYAEQYGGMPATHTRAFGYCMKMRGYEWVWNKEER